MHTLQDELDYFRDASARHLIELIDKDKEIEALQARIKELEAQQGWKDIKDAPRDGTPVDVYTGNAEFPVRQTDAEFREPNDSDWWVYGCEEPEPNDGLIDYKTEKVWFGHMGMPLTGDYEPTHFMETPTPPLRNKGGELIVYNPLFKN